MESTQPAIPDKTAHDGSVLLRHPRLVVLLRARTRQFDTGNLAEIEHGLVHGRRIVIAILATKRKQQRPTNRFDVLENKRAASMGHRQAFRPFSWNIGHHKAVHEVAGGLTAASMFAEVDLEIATQQSFPSENVLIVHRTADRFAHFASTWALPRKVLFSYITRQPVDGGGADRVCDRLDRMSCDAIP
ncbi:hypothetical protein [Paraburkholderia sp. RL17-373-BIF-A]|uniref:hypothetical protein n=1 Tax=Paraburkholderia sp. RL17-373-BIF-A TaxID=3031629 RepID=UPI0038BDFAF9